MPDAARAVDATAAVALLMRAPLRNIVALKMMRAFGDAVHCATTEAGDVLVCLRAAASPYDVRTYPDAVWVVMADTHDASAWGNLRSFLPRDVPMIFKLNSAHDADVLIETCALTRVTAFVTMSGGSGDATQATCMLQLPAAAEPVFAAQGYTRDDITRMLHDEDARLHLAQAEGRVAAGCFTFKNHAHVYEIGGVFTAPALRRRGLARAVVGSALADLHARGLTARYQFQEGNEASRLLAQSLGMTHAVTVTHFRGAC
jgi:GNAT superfamily N-acetyltransferase